MWLFCLSTIESTAPRVLRFARVSLSLARKDKNSLSRSREYRILKFSKTLESVAWYAFLLFARGIISIFYDSFSSAGLCCAVLEAGLDKLLCLLTDFFNGFLKTETVPDIWRPAEIALVSTEQSGTHQSIACTSVLFIIQEEALLPQVFNKNAVVTPVNSARGLPWFSVGVVHYLSF